MAEVYETVEDGEWFEPRRDNWRDVCCDCGLVHRMQFRIVEGKIKIRVWRDNRATAQIRRHMKRRAQEAGS